MRSVVQRILVFGLLLPGVHLLGQEDMAAPGRLFVRASIYPTASLSRYDYNNDIDLYEIRAYVELREDSQTGDVIPEAEVAVNDQSLEWKSDHYEIRIPVPKNKLPDECRLQIRTTGGRQFKQKYPLPTWLILTSPQPSILDASGVLTVSWKFSRGSSPVDVHIYNFKSGEEILGRRHVYEDELGVPPDQLPKSTIVRIYVMQSWILKQYLYGGILARGSEINLIPWSQVFIRIE